MVELEPEAAQWIEANAPGTLEALEPRALAAPPRDRMIRTPRSTR